VYIASPTATDLLATVDLECVRSRQINNVSGELEGEVM
jgi:hypothetical protein